MTPRRGLAALACASALVLSACSAGSPTAQPAATRATKTADGSGATPPPFRSERSLPRPALPVRVRIPSLGVDAAVEQLGRLPDGTVDVPHAWDVVGCYREGPRPSEPGPAVLLGHLDSQSGPAVFVRLRELGPGAVVETVGQDASVHRFVVRQVEVVPKDHFPTDDVYLPTLDPELRLVTCGGAFDRATGHYVDNVVAFAVAAAPGHQS